jgi:phosphohistidine phosphatase SixA
MNGDGLIVVLRHALAGTKWDDPVADTVRSLDAQGAAAAAALPSTVLALLRPSRIVSSPYLRCTETVAPLAGALGVEIGIDDALGPDATRERILALLAAVEDGALLCTHGEVIARAFDGLTCAKGAFWLVRRRGEGVAPALYVTPDGSDQEPGRDSRAA